MAGLLATQGIRGGLNREVLNRVGESGAIFFAVSDREWILDGANVHVSMIAFDDGTEQDRILDGRSVLTINSNLTSTADITLARKLSTNAATGFVADVKAGAFDLPDGEALGLLTLPNPQGKPNSDVLLPWVNGLDVLRRLRNYWIIDFGGNMPLATAARYEKPFARVKQLVLPERSNVKRAKYRDHWWIHAEPCMEMRRSVSDHDRFLVTTTISKHRIFAWLTQPTLPDHQLIAFARSDDYFFGLLHSRLHEVWARAQGTQLRERESGFRYTPTTCFETFPFPEGFVSSSLPGSFAFASSSRHATPAETSSAASIREAIAAAAKELDDLRSRWLNPPEWTREEVLEFPGSADGPWKRYLHEPDARGIGTVRYPRIVPKDAESAASLQKRTLTNLYNERPAWLDIAHRKLDEAVFAAYGWPADLSDEQILERLLALNLERAG